MNDSSRNDRKADGRSSSEVRDELNETSDELGQNKQQKDREEDTDNA